MKVDPFCNLFRLIGKIYSLVKWFLRETLRISISMSFGSTFATFYFFINKMFIFLYYQLFQERETLLYLLSSLYMTCYCKNCSSQDIFCRRKAVNFFQQHNYWLNEKKLYWLLESTRFVMMSFDIILSLTNAY